MRARLEPDTLAMTVVLALLTALGPLSTDMYLPALPTIARELASDAAGVQLTLSAFLIGFAVGQFAYGPVSDRMGRRPVLLAGMALFSLGSAACALAPSIEALVTARFVQAVGASGPIVLARAIVRDLYDGPRAGRELSRMGTIMGVVPAVAPVLGGGLLAAFGWRSNFVAAVLVGLALGAFVFGRLPETLRTRADDSLSVLAILRDFRQLLGHSSYRLHVGLAALTYAGLFAFISGSSFVLQEIYGLTALAFAASFAVMVLGYIAGTLVAQRAVGRIGLAATIRIGTVCLAFGGLAMLAGVLGIASSWALTAPMALYAAGVGLTLPQAAASAMAPFPQRAGAASSLLGICQMTFAALVGVGLGQALGASPLPLPLVVAGTGVLAFGLVWTAPRTG